MSEREADLLDAAADLLEKEGWIQGTYGSDQTGYCTMGALSQSSMGTARWMVAKAAQRLSERIKPEADGHPLWIVEWNDIPGRTQQEVLDTLRSTAKEARAEGDG